MRTVSHSRSPEATIPWAEELGVRPSSNVPARRVVISNSSLRNVSSEASIRGITCQLPWSPPCMAVTVLGAVIAGTARAWGGAVCNWPPCWCTVCVESLRWCDSYHCSSSVSRFSSHEPRFRSRALQFLSRVLQDFFEQTSTNCEISREKKNNHEKKEGGKGQ